MPAAKPLPGARGRPPPKTPSGSAIGKIILLNFLKMLARSRPTGSSSSRIGGAAGPVDQRAEVIFKVAFAVDFQELGGEI